MKPSLLTSVGKNEHETYIVTNGKQSNKSTQWSIFQYIMCVL